MKQLIEALWEEQSANWPMMQKGYSDLEKVVTRDLSSHRKNHIAQHNPARIVSSGAKVDAASIAKRKCFLCPKQLGEGQKGIAVLGQYLILINPFPILYRHFTIPHLEHIDQQLWGRVGDMCRIAQMMESDYQVYFNGAKAGASAPDHFHFQAGPRGVLPLTEERVDLSTLKREGESLLGVWESSPRSVLYIRSSSIEEIENMVEKIREVMVEMKIDTDLFNLVCDYHEHSWHLWFILRSKHRPDCYFAEGEDNYLISPGVVDMCGISVLPKPEDYERITPELWESVLEEVSLKPEQLEEFMHHLTHKIGERTR